MEIQLVVCTVAYSPLYTLSYFIYPTLPYIPYSTLYTLLYLIYPILPYILYLTSPQKPMQF